MKNKIELIIKPRDKNIGILVRRVLPWQKKRMVGPFIFLDEMGPAVLEPPKDHMDVRPHPHIGLSTLTYLFQGKLMHRDSLGVQQLIVPGEVNWMTAGSGISHSEREPAEERAITRNIHGLQFWVALPKDQEDVEPSFYHYKPTDIPEIQTESLTLKVVAGSVLGKTSNLKAYSPMTFIVMESKKQGLFSYEKEDHEHAIYVVKDKIILDGIEYHEKQMIVFNTGTRIEVEYFEGAVFVLIGGERFPEERYIWWNLVSSSKEKINRARQEWINGTFPQVPGDHEKIPAPEEMPIIADYP